MPAPTLDFAATLRALKAHGVHFIVVGGVSAALQGAPIVTLDIDIVHSRQPDNIDRLLQALAEIDAHYRIPGRSTWKPDVSHLSSPGHQLLMTRFGPLDLLGCIGSGLDYDALLADTTEMEAGVDLRVRVLNLETLVRIKEEVGGEKDRAMLPVLRRTLLEKQRGKP